MSQEILNAISRVASFKPVSLALSGETNLETQSAADDFTTLMRQVLTPGQDKKVSEEDLFAGLIQERIKALKGEEALKKFQTLFNEEKKANTNQDGFVAIEEAARKALKRFVTSGELSKEEGDKIHSEAFNAAQLDDNKQALFDSRGGANDPTMAVELMEKALLMAKTKLEALSAGTESAEERPLDAIYDPRAGLPAHTSSTVHKSDVSGPARPMDGANGFLFKPQSDSDGKLVILLPEHLTGDVRGVTLKNRRGKEIEAGMYRGIGNGDREHFRFRSPGQDYPKNIMVEVQLKNGDTKTYKIPNPGQRYD